MDRPFLTIVTRACNRPKALEHAVLSVVQQTCKDVEQIFIVDREQAGRWAADKSLNDNVDRVDGELVYILDDDCFLNNLEMVAQVKDFYERYRKPDVVMMRSLRPQIKPHILPHAWVWGHSEILRMSTTNCLCYAIKRDVWKEHIWNFGEKHAGGDWHFLESVRDSGASFGWMDIQVAQTGQIGSGIKFEAVAPGWFERVVQKYRVEEIAPDDWRLRLWTWTQFPRKWIPGEQRVVPEPVQEIVAEPQGTGRRPDNQAAPRSPKRVRPAQAHSLHSRRKKP